VLFLVLVMFSFVKLAKWLVEKAGVFCTSQEIASEHTIQNDLYCVQWRRNKVNIAGARWARSPKNELGWSSWGGAVCPSARGREELCKLPLVGSSPWLPRALVHFVFFGWALLQSCCANLINLAYYCGGEKTFAPMVSALWGQAPLLPPRFWRL